MLIIRWIHDRLNPSIRVSRRNLDDEEEDDDEMDGEPEDEYEDVVSTPFRQSLFTSLLIY